MGPGRISKHITSQAVLFLSLLDGKSTFVDKKVPIEILKEYIFSFLYQPEESFIVEPEVEKLVSRYRRRLAPA